MEIFKPNNSPIKDKFTTTTNGIHIKGLSVQHADKTILDNVDLTVTPNKRIAIIGNVGSGKSTLLKAIMKLTDYKGVIKLGDIDIDNADVASVRNKITYIQQHPRLFNRSCYYNIIYVTNATKNDVDELISRYDIRNVFGNVELDKKVGKNGEFLSGGQKQIVCLLRCFLKPTTFLLFDEITSSLDQNLKKKIMFLINELSTGKTSIIVTHDTYLLDKVDEIYTVTDSRIVPIKVSNTNS
jgi:ABC-type transport system involved in cytochrome bd biosynthesis fused ATPase/permease subunit